MDIEGLGIGNALSAARDGLGRLVARVWETEEDSSPVARADRGLDYNCGLASHERMVVAETWQGWGIGRTLVRNHVRPYRRMGFTTVFLTAAKAGGGYAWARAGFTADEISWSNLKVEIDARLGALSDEIDGDTFQECLSCLELGGRNGRWRLADQRIMIGSEPLGSRLLRGTRWDGVFDLTEDGEDAAIERLEAWAEEGIRRWRAR